MRKLLMLFLIASAALLAVAATFTVPTIVPITSLSATNATMTGQGLIYSNSAVSVSGVDGVGFRPFGGNYYGLTITNSYLISSTNEQAAMGFPEGGSVNIPTNVPLNFYDISCISTGSNGDAVSWKEAVGAPTNGINFFNCQFLAAHYAFNQVGSRSTFTFRNCNFRAMGPSGEGASVCFLPDQGWLTNYLYDCNFVAANGGDVATWCYLSQFKTVNYFYGCSFEASDTNNVGAVACMELSGEGQYITEFNSCTFSARGGATTKIIDLSSGGGAPDTLYLNNCTWKGSPGTVVDNTGGSTTIVVSGGNFTPANFSTMAGVTFTNYSPITNFTAYSSGTIYTMTASAALLDFGTTDPSVTINQAGTYLIRAGASFETRGATYAATNAVTLKLRRTNNTAADVTSASTSCLIPIMTTISGPLNDITTPDVIYTATSGDIIQAWGLVQATPSAGSVACDSAWVMAVRLY